MADLKDAIRHKLFGGKLKFRKDMEDTTEVSEEVVETPEVEVEVATEAESTAEEESEATSA